jgi:hypothetical protein
MNRLFSITLASFVVVLLLSAGVIAGSNNWGISDSNIGNADKKVELTLSPEEQITRPDRWTEYTLIVKDNHDPVNCIAIWDCGEFNEHKYSLKFNSDSTLQMARLPAEVTLKAGEEKKIVFYLKGRRLGSYDFVISAYGEESYNADKVEGRLFVTFPYWLYAYGR